MKILFVASDKNGKFSPFVEEQKNALIQEGVSIVTYGHKAHGILNYIKEISTLRKAILKEQPDVIHAHFGLTGLMTTIAVVGLKMPVVVTYHGCDVNDKKLLPFSRMAMRLANWNIFVSHQQMKLALRGSMPRKSSVVPCGIDISNFNIECIDNIWFEEKFQKSKNVLFAGSFDSVVKNSILAKQAIEIYNNLHTDDPISLLELRGYSRNEVATLMNKCNALLLTSLREGSPQVIKEAMACGCPIVSVDVGDVAERLKDVEGNMVVSTRDPEELAKALEYIIPYGRTKGREKLLEDGLDNKQIAKKVIDIYTTLTIK